MRSHLGRYYLVPFKLLRRSCEGGGFAAVLFALLSFNAWARRWIFRVVTRHLWTHSFHSENKFIYSVGSPIGRGGRQKWVEKGELGSLSLTTSRTSVSCHTKVWQSSASSPFDTHQLDSVQSKLPHHQPKCRVRWRNWARPMPKP